MDTVWNILAEWGLRALIAAILTALSVVGWRKRDKLRNWYQGGVGAWSNLRDIPGDQPAKVALAISALAATYWIAQGFDSASFVFARIIVSAWTAFLFVLTVIPLVPPLMEGLRINPNRNRVRPDGTIAPWPYPVSRRGFFTGLQPGRVKMRETQGESFIDPLMDYDGKIFQGEVKASAVTLDNQRGFWKAVDTPVGDEDSHPIPFPEPKDLGSPDWWRWLITSPFSLTWWMWKRYVYWLSGDIFVGPPGFRTLHIYPMDRMKLVVVNGIPTLVQVIDWSDHYRVAQFEFPFFVPNAETQNMVPIKAMLNVICHVENPYLMAYNTDDQWSHRLLAACSSAVGVDVRGKPIKEVTPARTIVEVKRLLEPTVAPFGLAIDDINVVDLTPSQQEHADRLAEPELAIADREAAETLAIGNAAPIRESGRALAEFPEAAVIAVEEVRVRLAAALAPNQNAVAFLGGSPGPEQMGAATFMELSRMRRDGRLPPVPTAPPAPVAPVAPAAGP